MKTVDITTSGFEVERTWSPEECYSIDDPTHDAGTFRFLAGAARVVGRGISGMSPIASYVLAFAATTVPLQHQDLIPQRSFSTDPALVWAGYDTRGQCVSVGEARRIALQILADTERRLVEERAAESRFFLQPWDDED